MINLSQNQKAIIKVILEFGVVSSSKVHEAILSAGQDISLITTKRILAGLMNQHYLSKEGVGRATVYKISAIGRLFADINAKEYVTIEPDRRYGLASYNFDLFSNIPQDIFNENELKILDEATSVYHKRTADISEVLQKKELERLIIELAWKSSKIEGNTYTLLDTEKLILENKEAEGHSKIEAQMILNHKKAFSFIHNNANIFKTLTRENTEELHKILVKDMQVGFGMREKAVGVVGSKYRPLDNAYQINEAVQALSAAIIRTSAPCAKALVALLGISYVQPFEDGNKRTARLMANAVLLAHKHAPLSYRSVDENEYRAAMITFYEINSIIPLKKIFIEQYDFAAKNYAVK